MRLFFTLVFFAHTFECRDPSKEQTKADDGQGNRDLGDEGDENQRTCPEEYGTVTFLALLQILPITVDDETALRAWQDTLRLARLHDLTVYDAAYLELAVRLDLPLASLDDRLKAAIAYANVSIERVRAIWARSRGGRCLL